MIDYNHKISKGSPIRGEYLKLSRAKAIYKAALGHPFAKDIQCYVNGKGDAVIKMRLTHLEIPDEPVFDIHDEEVIAIILPSRRRQYTRSICAKKRFSNRVTSFKCKAVCTPSITVCIGRGIC